MEVEPSDRGDLPCHADQVDSHDGYGLLVDSHAAAAVALGQMGKECLGRLQRHGLQHRSAEAWCGLLKPDDRHYTDVACYQDSVAQGRRAHLYGEETYSSGIVDAVDGCQVTVDSGLGKLVAPYSQAYCLTSPESVEPKFQVLSRRASRESRSICRRTSGTSASRQQVR